MARPIDHVDIGNLVSFPALVRREGYEIAYVDVGIARNTSRRNAFRPQPVSRVPSRRIALRTPLAMRDWIFLKPVSLRPIRCPAASPTRSPPLSIAEINSGKNIGLFCPSPSSVAAMAPRAARTPLRTAADWPDDV